MLCSSFATSSHENISTIIKFDITLCPKTCSKSNHMRARIGLWDHGKQSSVSNSYLFLVTNIHIYCSLCYEQNCHMLHNVDLRILAGLIDITRFSLNE